MAYPPAGGVAAITGVETIAPMPTTAAVTAHAKTAFCLNDMMLLPQSGQTARTFS
jgi:hypothetical protein